MMHRIAIPIALKDYASALRISIEKISVASAEALEGLKKVEEIEHRIDTDYLKTKKLFIKYGGQMNPGAIVIFDDLIEFTEQAADMCADTADYILSLFSRE